MRTPNLLIPGLHGGLLLVLILLLGTDMQVSTVVDVSEVRFLQRHPTNYIKILTKYVTLNRLEQWPHLHNKNTQDVSEVSCFLHLQRRPTQSINILVIRNSESSRTMATSTRYEHPRRFGGICYFNLYIHISTIKM
jgi:hypothetical protein